MRYFIVMYVALVNSGAQATGNMQIVSHTKDYPSRKRIIEIIEADELGLRNPVITNIIELTEEDYQQWIS